jgi:predicted RNA-binding protein YlqC (UPF0109 family)
MTAFDYRRLIMEATLKELVEVMAKALVDKPAEVEVTEVEGEQTTVIELRVAKEDLGKVIGKEGRTARSMRTILGAASTKLRTRSVLEILE